MIFVEMFTKGQLVRTQARRVPDLDGAKAEGLISLQRIDAGRAGKDESQRHAVAAGNGIGIVTYEIAIDAVVALILQGRNDAVALFVEEGDI